MSSVREAGPSSADAWLAAVRDAERRGELLAAFDLAEQGLDQLPGDLPLRFRAVLALARAGSTQEAARRFSEYGLADVDVEDVAALGARIKKDVALATEGKERRRLALDAAAAYRAISDRTGGYYPTVNAATLAFLAGDARTARSLAVDTLDRVHTIGDGSYYAVATEAEAHLLLGDVETAHRALRKAAALHGDDYGALSTTRKQLRTICLAAEIDVDVLACLAGPRVVHFCGHRIAEPDAAGRFSTPQVARAAQDVAEVVRRRRIGFAYGSLASGGDILWAEALLAAGAELHVVLPFALKEFIARSVEPAGQMWVKRFHRCLEAAVGVSYATDDAYLGDDLLFRYCSELAMGLALLRARYLDAEVDQLALWDGRGAVGEAGTAIDVATWRRAGHTTTVVTPDGRRRRPGAALAAPPTAVVDDRHGHRVVRAMLFADLRGFSKLTDEQLPRFAEEVLGAFATAIDSHGNAVEFRNTWGDGVYLVLSGPVQAAACALDLQDAMARIDLPAAGLPGHLALRMGGHVGPVFPIVDPVLRTPAFFGSHVSRTARIEPVTPPGAVYVTEPFAAALELAGHTSFMCDYVGHMPAAKDYGRLRMYRLRHAGAVDR
jgi:class 3 adenylate cyclase/tetratricopeptide (TPR) repeat protein